MTGDTITLTLARDDATLVRTALQLLVDTLGREEADELREVKALIRRLDEAMAETTSAT